jgi:hypothetical protein
LIIVGLTYLVSSMTGQVMVEKARREGISASGRALEARKVEAELGKRLDMLTSFASVDEWAKTHNFLPPDQLAATPGNAPMIISEAAKPAADGSTPGGLTPDGETPAPALTAPVTQKKKKGHKKTKVATDSAAPFETTLPLGEAPADSNSTDETPPPLLPGRGGGWGERLDPQSRIDNRKSKIQQSDSEPQSRIHHRKSKINQDSPDDGIRHNGAMSDATDVKDDTPAPVLVKHHHRKHKIAPKDEVLDVQTR